MHMRVNATTTKWFRNLLVEVVLTVLAVWLLRKAFSRLINHFKRDDIIDV